MDGPDVSALPPSSARVIGACGETSSGRTVVALGALHGNEPAGLVAIGNVLQTVRSRALPLRGRLIGVVGNLRAHAAGRRFVARDLNRGWSPGSCAAVAAADRDCVEEDAEQRELLACLRAIAADAQRPLVVVDLHSTSGRAAPFCVAPNLPRNLHLAVTLPIPFVRGLAEVIDGTLLDYLCKAGHEGLAIEGGQHEAPATADLLEASLWFSLVATGLLRAEQVPALHERRGSLRAASEGKPPLVDIIHRHAVGPHDEFVMEPGYENFVRVRAGELVAHDRNGSIRSPLDGLMMLPRYQAEGDDGFFLARAASPGWDSISLAARRALAAFTARG